MSTNPSFASFEVGADQPGSSWKPSSSFGGGQPGSSWKLPSSFKEHIEKISVGISSFQGEVGISSFPTVPEGVPEGVLERGESTGLSYSETVSNFVVFLIGGSILVLPTVLRDIGIVPGLSLMIIAFGTTYECCILTLRCCAIVESVAMNGVTIASYEALAGEALGSLGKSAVAITKNGYLLGLLVAYSVLLTDTFNTWIQYEKEIVRWCLTLPLFLAFVMVRDLKQIKRFSGLGICAAILQCALLSIGSGLEFARPDFRSPPYDLGRGSLLDVGASMAICLFGCGSVVCTIPAIRSQMARPEELPSAIRFSLALVLMVYLGAMFLCYFAYGRGLEGVALENIVDSCWEFQCLVGVLVESMLVINLMFSLPSIIFFVISVIESAGTHGIFVTMSLPNIGFRICLMGFLIFIGMNLPHVKEVVGVISAAFTGMNCLVFPRLLYFGTKRLHRGSAREMEVPTTCMEMLGHFAVLVVAIIAMPFGITGSVVNLLNAMNKA